MNQDRKETMINTMNQTNEIKQTKKLSFYSLVGISLCCLTLSSCSTYSSKFNCADGKGLSCEMMRSVDKKIDSGEIDKIYKPDCKGSKCRALAIQDEVVRPQSGPIRAKATIPDEFDDVIITQDPDMDVVPTE